MNQRIDNKDNSAQIVSKIAIFTASFIIVSFIFQLLAAFFCWTIKIEDNEDMMTLMNSAFSLIGAGLLIYVFTRYWDRTTFFSIGFDTVGRVKDFVAGCLLAVFTISVGFAILLLTSAVEIESVQVGNLPYLTITFLTFVIVAVLEEMVCRGYILNNMMLVMNRYLALALSSIIFAALHLFNPHVAALPVLNIFLAGIFLGISYIYTRNLWFPIGLHLFWNFMQGPVFGFNVSGMDISHTIVQLRYPENNIINGGDFGFEGSVLCSILCILGAFIIGFYYSRKGKK